MSKSTNTTKRRASDKFPRASRKADGEEGKRVPNSLIATLRAIRRLWNVPEEDGPRAPKQFAKDFEDTFKEITHIYPAYGDEANDIRKFIESIEAAGKHTREISYYHMRAFAEYVGIPVGLLMDFSHVLGDAARGFTRDDIENLIDSQTAALNALRDFISASDEEYSPLLEFKLNDGLLPRYNAKITALEVVQQAFQKTRRRPAKQTRALVG